MQPLESGDLVDLKLVEIGGFGKVYKGRSKKLGMEIALKTIGGHSDADFNNLMKEKDMMSRANYTYVLRLLGIYKKQEGDLHKYGLVMEYMPHGSLHTLFDKIANVPWALRFQILHQVVLGMNYLHHILEPPIIHRDLKPHNVLLNKSLDVQLTDFGLAKNETSVSSTTSVAGTVSYMPPEAFTSINYKPTKEFDVYSFAILTWSVLSGVEPYADACWNNIHILVPQHSRPDMNLVEKWTSKKMVPAAIQLMRECWDGDPVKRPSFSACIERTSVMNEAYVEEIHSDVSAVLDELRNLSSSSKKVFQAPDTPDEKKGSHPITNTTDMSFSIQIFREFLHKAVGPENPNRSVVPENSSQEVVDARAEFLKEKFAAIVQARPDVSDILDVLYSNHNITEEDMDTIKSGSAQEQIRKTLRMIMNNGETSCHEFLQLMKIHHASLMRSLQA